MSTIDNKVVEARFDNKAFLRGVQSTIDALGQLSKAMQLDHAARGISNSFKNVQRDLKIDASVKNVENSAGRISRSFHAIRQAMHLGDATKHLDGVRGSIDGVSAAGNRFSLAPMIGAVAGVSKQFNLMQVAGVTAIATITHKAIQSASQFLKGFTTAPIKQGLEEYETNLNAIQTILANTGKEGAKGLLEVNKALEELNAYSDKTIYNFSQMARNIGTFTAAGVKLDVATGAIKGIANLAALSGSNAEQASTAMYQLSQALASGTVKLMDWNSVVNAGMGGKVFQESLKETARAHNVAVDSIIKKEGSFRDSLQTGWLTSAILTETLAKFTGDLTAKQLKQMGYTEKQIKQIIKQGKVATDAATKVKTATQLVGTLKEAAASGWAKTWQLILGDFGEARDLFTGINNVLGGFIQKSADARNKVLGDWKALGGRTSLIQSVENAFGALIGVLAPVRDAFRSIFPPNTGKDLFELTTKLEKFTKSLRISKETSDLLKRTFSGVFAIFSILGQAVSTLGGTFDGVFGGVSKNVGGILEFTASIGDWLVALDKALQKNGDIRKFFDDIENAIQIPIEFLNELSKSIANLFNVFDTGDVEKFTNAMDAVGDRLSPLETIARGIGNLLQGVGRILGRVGNYLKDKLADIGSAITDVFSSENFNTALDVLNTGFLAAIVALLRKFFNSGLNINFSGGMVDTITGALEGVTSTLEAMQMNIKANAILRIAAAVALLTGSIVVLAMIDSARLTKALAAIGAGLIGMSLVMTVLSRSVDVLGAGKLVFISGAMIGVSTALLTLAAAVKIMSTIPVGDMYRGLFGLALGLGVISKVMRTMPTGMIMQAVALNAIATSLVILAGAMKLFGSISWDEMARGITALAGSLVVIAGAMHLMPKNMVMQAAALTILAGAVNAIALAVKVFGSISWDEMLHGLTGLGSALAVIAGAMRLMPKRMLLQSAALVAVAGALNVISLAVMSMSTMSWKDISRGLAGLGGSLVILAAGLKLMNGSLLGSAALLVAAGALAVLTPILIALGSLSWETLLHGLAALAGIFTVLGLAGLVLAPLVPVILGLSAAVVLIGAGMALAGVGALAFAAAFTAVVIAASAGVSVLADIVESFLKSIPDALAALGVGIVRLAGEIAKGAPEFFAAAVVIIVSILDAIIQNTPKIGEAFLTMMETALEVVVRLTPKVVSAGLNMILSFLEAVASKIGGIVDVVASIIVNFLLALGRNSGKIIDAAFKMIIDFINGVAEAIRENSDELAEAGWNLASSIIEGIINGIKALGGKAIDAIKGLGKGLLNGAKGVLGISSPSREFRKIAEMSIDGLIQGFEGDSIRAISAASSVGKDVLSALSKSLEGLSIRIDHMEMSPVISPVLDLTQAEREARKLLGLIPSSRFIEVNLAYSNAREASAGYDDNIRADYDDRDPDIDPSINFIQNNNSPKALNDGELYRNTKSQISRAKGVLADASRGRSS